MAPEFSIAHYRITAKLGQGGMGEVYRATDTKLNRDVAVKILPQAFAADPDRLARFTREAQVLAALNHPNIAAIYGVEERALVMELVEGPTLADRIAQGPVPLEEALPLMEQLIAALEYAHEKGVIHRDLKPANIKVTPEGRIKVLDFGLAKALLKETPSGDPQSSPTLTIRDTQPGVIVGTAAYMAPEQALGKNVDKRADIWAFGAVVYEMLAGSKLFAGEAIADTLAAVLKTEPSWNHTPPYARRLLRACLEKDPRQRLRDIGDAWRLLEPASSVNTTPRPTIWPWAVAAILAIALAAALFLRRGVPPLSTVPLRLKVDLGQDVLLRNTRGGLAISPDGRRLAFLVRGGDGTSHIRIRRLDQDDAAVTLPGTAGATNLFFSPDGQWIGFAAGHKLKKISADGGASVTLCDAPGAVGASWGDDGYIIATLDVGMSGLWRVPSSGGAPAPLTVLKPERGELRHSWPQVLPGSRLVLFSSYAITGGPQAPKIEILSLKTGVRKILRDGFFARYLSSGHLVYIAENTLFAAPFDLARLELAGPPRPVVPEITPYPNAMNALDYGGTLDFSQNGTFVSVNGGPSPQRSIFWIDGKTPPRPLHAAPGIYSYPRLSPDGRRLAFAVEDAQGHEDIWLRDIERDAASKLTLLAGANEAPVWNPDGRSIIFLSENPSAPGIYSIRTDGTREAKRLMEVRSRLVPHSISPDGKRLAGFVSLPSGGFSIWIAPFEGSAGGLRLGPLEMLGPSAPLAIDRDPVFSPDGRWLAYGSNPSGDEIYVRPSSGSGERVQVSTAGGSFPMWSRAGRQLFFRASGGIMAVDYQEDHGIFKAGKPRLWLSQRFPATSPPVPLYDVSPDGKQFAVILASDSTAEPKPLTHVTFFLNFFDELRRRVQPGL